MSLSNIIDLRPTLRLFSRNGKTDFPSLQYKSSETFVHNGAEITLPDIYASMGKDDPSVYLRIAHNPATHSGGFLLTPDNSTVTMSKAHLSLLDSYWASYRKFWEANQGEKDTNDLRARWADESWYLVDDHIDPETGEKPYKVTTASFSHVGEPVDIETLEGPTPSGNRTYLWHEITQSSANSGPPKPGMVPIISTESRDNKEDSTVWWMKLEGFSSTF